MKICKAMDLGRIRYQDAFALQQRLVAARKAGDCPDVLLFCEHPAVITLGRNGKLDHLRISREELSRRGVEFHLTDRGGDITYHGPGQIVAYPILQLGEIQRDVGWYVQQLEQAMIDASAAFGVEAVRVAGQRGVWVRAGGPFRQGQGSGGGSSVREASTPGENPPAAGSLEKIGAIGVHLSRWVTSHGLAYNVSTDLRYFDLIVPCGIRDCRATSLERLLGRAIAAHEVQPHLAHALGRALGLRIAPAERSELDDWLCAVPAQAAAAAARAAGEAP